MKTFKDFLIENETILEIKTDTPKVKVGDKVTVQFKKINGDIVTRGEHHVTKVAKNHFEVDRLDHENQPMKFKHNGYGKDYQKASSGKIKGMSKSYGHMIQL